MDAARTIDDQADGWYVHDPNIRPEPFGPMRRVQAECVQHVLERLAVDGAHSFHGCPRHCRAMCRHRPDDLCGGLEAAPDLAAFIP